MMIIIYVSAMLNSLRPSDAYMRPTIIDGAKPLSEPMLGYCSLEFKIVVWKMAAILSRPQCVNGCQGEIPWVACVRLMSAWDAGYGMHAWIKHVWLMHVHGTIMQQIQCGRTITYYHVAVQITFAVTHGRLSPFLPFILLLLITQKGHFIFVS